MARKKKPRNRTISVTYPTRLRRFRCCLQYQDNTGHWHREEHQLVNGAHLTICPEKYCLAMLCEEHWPAHETQHTLAALANEGGISA